MFTLSHLVASFDANLQVAVKTGQRKPATRHFYQFQLQKLVKDFGGFPAGDLRPHHLVTVEFSNAFVRALKRLYHWAADEELVPKNPFRKITVPQTGQRTRVLTNDEFTKLVAASGRKFASVLLVGRETAARPGELRELLWRSVHLDQRIILLTSFKAKDRRKDGVAVRRIPLTPVAVDVLQQLRAEQSEPGPDSHVFRGRGGHPFSSVAMRCQMARIRKLAGLEDNGKERIVLYTLRHTRATDLTRKGVRDNQLAEILGHASMQMTRRYQHLDAADLNDIIDRADGRER